MDLIHLAEIASARSVEGLKALAADVAGTLGFERYAISVVTEASHEGARFVGVDNCPAEFRSGYEDVTVARKCPVMRHLKRSSAPILWDRDTYDDSNRGLWEEQESFGYGAGMAVAAHLPRGKHVLVGFTRRAPLQTRDTVRLTHTLGAFQIFAAHAIEASISVLSPVANIEEAACPLTPRQLEALHWTLEGKTAWEVGQILGISERTAALHINTAGHKIGTSNKIQTALKALRLGWIELPRKRRPLIS